MTVGTRDGVLNKTKPCPEELMLAGEADHRPGTCVSTSRCCKDLSQSQWAGRHPWGWDHCCTVMQGEGIARTGPVRARGRTWAGEGWVGHPLPPASLPFHRSLAALEGVAMPS